MSTNLLTVYRKAIERELTVGGAGEHAHRSSLKALLEAAMLKTIATNEPKRVQCGAPDFQVSLTTAHGPLTIGYVETKDIGVSLADIEKDSKQANPTTREGEQLKRYRNGIPNLILTDYLEFSWYVKGQRRAAARLGAVTPGLRLEIEKGGLEAVLGLLRDFLSHRAEPVGRPKELAERMARLTHLLRDVIVVAFETGTASDALSDLRQAFSEVLIPDLSVPDFADMFAQTLAYGLFAARVNHDEVKGRFQRLGAAGEIPKTNPFLRKLFGAITGPDLDDEPFAGFVDDLVQLLADTDMGAVLADFGKRTRQEDPVVHFYETFLAAYDPKLREMRGVYYTPEPVVSYIVRSVDSLLKTRFGCPEGLAEIQMARYVRKSEKGEPQVDEGPRVLILDPACGTGTFLYAVVNLIREKFMSEGNAGKWSGYVRDHLLPRLFGFELLMAPYAVAHLKLGMQLAALDLPEAQRRDWAYGQTGMSAPPRLGYEQTGMSAPPGLGYGQTGMSAPPRLGYEQTGMSAPPRLGIYLTNSLEEAAKKSELLMGAYISEEANAAAEIKRDLPIMVVLGNPPYSGHSANKGPWIKSLVRDYYHVDGQPLRERNPKWLQDDYVKFLRFAQWRISETGSGVLAFITNHGYLDNPTFRGMRQQLMKAFTDIYILDLHGSSRKREQAPDGGPDENVFDIQQGVAIGIFVKDRHRATPAKAHYAQLWGTREDKYAWLVEQEIETTEWSVLAPESPSRLLVPQDTDLRAEYERGWKVTEIMSVNALGFQTHRDPVAIAHDEPSLLRQVRDYLRRAPAPASWGEYRCRADYRPFDTRWAYLGSEVADRPRLSVVRHLFHENLVVNLVRQTKAAEWRHAFVSRNPTPAVFVEIKDGSSIFPLYLYPSEQEVASGLFPVDEQTRMSAPPVQTADGQTGMSAPPRRANFNPEFVQALCEKLNVALPDWYYALVGNIGKEKVGQTFLSAQDEGPALKITRRRLPHWTLEGSTYFVTFRLALGTLSPDEITLVRDHIISGDPQHYSLIAATVMPDHIHLLLKPQPGVPLSRIMKGIKGVTARLLNQRRGQTGMSAPLGSLWQDESFDRIVRDQNELDEKLNYMLCNPVKKELCEDPWGYQGWHFKGRTDEERADKQTENSQVGQTFLSAQDDASIPITITPEDVFHYIYAILHSPTYRSRYAEFLKIDFPRIPLTSDLGLFRRLAAKGAELVALHLLEDEYPWAPWKWQTRMSAPPKPITRYPIPGDNLVEPGHPRYVAGQTGMSAPRVYISKDDAKTGKRGQYFEGVPPEVWNFHVGGYKVCEKWLKDRRGLTLSTNNQDHYERIVVALKETIRLMAEIDAAIPTWPLT